MNIKGSTSGYLDTIYPNLKWCANASVVWCSGRMTMERVLGVGIDFHYHTVVTVVPHLSWPTCTAACSSWVWVTSVLQTRNMLIWPEKTILICTVAEQNAVPKLLTKRRFVISMFYIQPFQSTRLNEQWPRLCIFVYHVIILSLRGITKFASPNLNFVRQRNPDSGKH